MSLDESQLAMLNTLIYQPGFSEAYDCWSETSSDASVSAWDFSPNHAGPAYAYARRFLVGRT